MSFCYRCGKPVEDGMKFCAWCGAAVATSAPSAVPAQVVAPVEATVPMDDPTVIEEAPVKKSRKKWFWLLGAVALVTVLAMLLTMFLGGGSKKPSFFLYMKGDELWFNPGNKAAPRLISDDFEGSNVQVSSDGKMAFYLEDDDLYYSKIGSDERAQKLESNVDSFQINSKGTAVLYLKNDTLYRHNLKSKKVLEKDVVGFYATGDLNTILFGVGEGGKNLYVRRGNKTEEILQVDEEDDKVTLVAFAKTLDTAWYVHEDDLYQYTFGKKTTKISGDVLRVVHVYDSGEMFYLKEGDKSGEYEIYYYNGKKEVLLYEDVVGVESSAAERPVVAFTVRDGDKYEVYVAVKDTVSKLDADEPGYFRLTADGKTMYFLDDIDEDSREGDLYRALIGSTVRKPTLYDEDVATYTLSLADDKPIYYKDMDDDYSGDLYRDGKFVDREVRSNFSYSEESGELVYRTDYEDGTYTLNTYNGKKSTTIAKDVSDHSILPNGNVVYIKDYDEDDEEGELYLFKNGKSVKVDDGVEEMNYAYSFGMILDSYEYEVISILSGIF